MYRVELIIQDSPGYTSSIADGVTRLAAANADFVSMRVAMAYASGSGCRDLCEHLEASMPRWGKVRKQWLLSIDFGRTEPDAITSLGALPNSEVRLANGRTVLDRRLVPVCCFHPKTYVFESKDNAGFGLFVGSGNLTLSGLHTGSEHATAHLWLPKFSPEESAELTRAKERLRWWDEAWARATKTDTSTIQEYTRLRKDLLVEDDAESVRPLVSRGSREIDVHPGLAWVNAKCLWVETHGLYKNLGKNRPGNQLDLKRGTRVYFGFSADVVPPKSIFGNVYLQFVGQPEVERSVRFGNNSMDKINLPIPGQEGPPSYDNSAILFERRGPGRFRMRLGIRSDREAWRKKSEAQGLVFEMAGGRAFGFFS
jgi:hypothetical protein